jgi:hypothetical protein
MGSEARTAMTMQRIERTLAGSPVAETVLNIFKAALSTAPFTGGLASLITDYIPSSRFRRLEEFAQRVAEDLKTVAGQVDQAYLQTDEFAHVFERSFKGRPSIISGKSWTRSERFWSIRLSDPMSPKRRKNTSWSWPTTSPSCNCES